jgi:hypothetical protein
MSTLAISHTIGTDDDGSGRTGTIVNNALFDAIQDAVDTAIGQTVQAKTGAYTVLTTDDVVRYTGSGGVTLTLHTAVGYTGKVVEVINDSTGTITIDPDGSETIDGAASYALVTLDRVRLRSNGANWFIIGNVIVPSFVVTDVAHDGADFTVSPGEGTWTVEAADLVTFAYIVIQDVAFLWWKIDNSTLAGGNPTYLQIELPAALTPTKTVRTRYALFRNVTGHDAGIAEVSAGAGAVLQMRRTADGSTFSAETNTLDVSGWISFPV